MRRLLFSVVLAMTFNTIIGQTLGQFNPTVYTKPLPKIITVPNQPSDFKITSHMVNIKVPADSAKNWSHAMEKRYIKRLFTVVKDVDCLILNYSGFYISDGTSSYTIGNGFSFEINIQNSVRNIGLALFNNSALYNSEKLLQITTLSEDHSLSPQIVTHEFFHQWNSFLESANYWLIDPSHHTGLVEESNSVFYGRYSGFKHVKDSIFSVQQAGCTGFPGKLEGYLAGLWDMPDELRTLKNYSFYSNWPRVDNGDGTSTVQVKADSLVVLKKTGLFNLYGGERNPNYKNPKNHFDGAVVVFSLNDFLSDDKLKGFHYSSMLNEFEGTAAEYNNLYDQICSKGKPLTDVDYSYRQVNIYHSSYKKLHFSTRLFKDDGTKYEVPNYDGVIAGNASVCSGSTNVVYSIPAIKNATSYVWTLPSGATGTSTTNSITVNYGIAASSGNISVKGRNDVSDGNVTVLPIHILDSKSLPSLPDPIIGRNLVCAGQNSVLYTVSEIANASSYVWTLPAGASGTSSTNTISVSYSSTASPGEISVKGINCNGAGESRKLAVIVNQLPANIEIEGPTSISMGDTVKYSIPLVPSATSYSWFGPFIIGKTTSNSILLCVKEKTSSFGFNVVVYTGCGVAVASKSKVVMVITGPPAIALPGAGGVISGPGSICIGGFATYTVPPISNATKYLWYGAGEEHETSVNSINLPAPKGNISSFGLFVTGINSTGKGTPSTAIAINLISPPPAPVITLNGKILSSNAISGNQWYNLNNPISGATNQNYTITADGEYTVQVTQNGCVSPPSNMIKDIVTSIATIEYNEKIKVYPNPVSDDLTIEFKGNTDEIEYAIYNSAGQLVTTGLLLENTVVHTSSFSSGVYTIKFNTGINFDFRKIIKHN